MKTIFCRIIAGVVTVLLGCVAAGCSLMVTSAGGSFGRSGAYSGWKCVRHDGEKFLVSPYGDGEFYVKKYGCFLWGTLDYPVKMMVRRLILYYKEFPYFCVYQKGSTEKLDVRENPSKDYEADGFRVRLQIEYDTLKKALVTIVAPGGDSRQFEMKLAAE